MPGGFSSSSRGQVEPTAPGSSTNALIVAVIAIAALYFGRDVFVPMALAILLSFVIGPPVRFLQGWGLGRVFPVVAVVLLTFMVIFAIGGIMTSQVTQLAGNLPQYQSNIRQKITDLRGATAGTGPLERSLDMLQELGLELSRSDKSASAKRRAADAAEQRPVPVELHEPDPGSLATLRNVLTPLLHPLGTTGLVVIFVIFILLQREDLRNRLIRLAGSHDLQRTTAAINDAASRLSRLFLTQVALNSFYGLVVGTGLWLIGVPSPILWGILAAISRFVPYIGSIIAAAFPLMLASAVDPGWTMVLAAAAFFVIVDVTVGHLIEPLLYGHSTGLSPVAVIASATFWTWLWGPIGLILATPLTVCLVVLGRHVDRLEFLDVMLGDRPPLTAAETFYQRTLAGDPDEAADQAERFLKERSLTAYYDEVALRGLLLAQNDAARGVLDPARMTRMENAVTEVIDDLSDHDDTVPAPAKRKGSEAKSELEPSESDGVPSLALPVLTPEMLAENWRSEAPILCIGGHTPLDRSAAAMLAQVLDKHGLKARVEGADALSTANLFRLETDGVVMVCLSYLDATSPVSIRYAVRRLRRKLPKAELLVCCWGLTPAEAETLGEAVRAELTAASLTQALTICIGAAAAPQPEGEAATAAPDASVASSKDAA